MSTTGILFQKARSIPRGSIWFQEEAIMRWSFAWDDWWLDDCQGLQLFNRHCFHWSIESIRQCSTRQNYYLNCRNLEWVARYWNGFIATCAIERRKLLLETAVLPPSIAPRVYLKRVFLAPFYLCFRPTRSAKQQHPPFVCRRYDTLSLRYLASSSLEICLCCCEHTKQWIDGTRFSN